MSHSVIQRTEMLGASLNLGGQPLDLSEYSTTGLMALAVGPRGFGKTNAGLLMAEQLSAQGWVSVLIDPEGELESIYGAAVGDAESLRQRLTERDVPIVVVSAKDALEFIPYGQVILEVADELRKPLFVCIDEGQLFSAARKRADGVGEACDIIAQFADREGAGKFIHQRAQPFKKRNHFRLRFIVQVRLHDIGIGGFNLHARGHHIAPARRIVAQRFVVKQEVDNIEAEPVHPAFQPVTAGIDNCILHSRIVIVEVRLLF